MLAYLLTWTTYGTWLPGDRRTSKDRKRKRPLAPDPVLERQMRVRMTHPALTLDGAQRRCVREAIEAYCKFKGWHLYALHVRTNHVHAVVGALGDAQRAIGGLKARATRLLREAGLVADTQPVWTSEGGDARKLLDHDSVVGACDYVRYGQGPALPES
jgi:REP element-mobilizing transposase RayT